MPDVRVVYNRPQQPIPTDLVKETAMDIEAHAMTKHDLELAVLTRRVEALEADARLSKNFRNYVMKQFVKLDALLAAAKEAHSVLACMDGQPYLTTQ